MNTFAKLAYSSAATSALVMAITASAQTAVTDIKAPTPHSAYVQDSRGNIVRDQFGQCVRTGYWTPADATVVGCDGVVAKAAEPVAKAAPAAPAAKPVPTAEKVTYAADTFFDFDKSVLKAEGKQKLNEIVAKLKDINLEAVVATGHTDSIGTDAYNQKLSVRRAEAVKHYLVHNGVPADRIYVSGKGKSQPICDDSQKAKKQESKSAWDACRAKNRRVEVEVVGTRGGAKAAPAAPAAKPEQKPHHHMHHDKKHHAAPKK